MQVVPSSILWHHIHLVLSCGCRCALVLIDSYMCSSHIRDEVYIFFFIYQYTILRVHNIAGSQYLEYVDPGNLLLVLYSFIFTRVFVLMTRPPKKLNLISLRRFSPRVS